jgi:hypothetical protein
MGKRMAFALLAAIGCATLPTPLTAQQGQPKPAKDPNEKVCEKQTVLGSRLTTHRVCATREQWAEYRRLDREAIDKAQRSPNGPSGQ